MTVDPTTGVASDNGPLTEAISCLVFRSNGTLYAVSGEQGPNPETLFTVDTSNAALTLACVLGNGADGETIGIDHGAVAVNIDTVRSGATPGEVHCLLPLHFVPNRGER